MKGKDFLKDIWNMVEVNRPGFVLEEPAFRYQSLSVNKSIEQIYQNRYQKYEALNAGRTDNVGVMDCMFGTHILPCLFGGEERVFADGHTYLEGPIIFSPEDVYKLKVNDIKTGVIGRQIEILKYMADKTQGEIPIRVGDIQNPLGVLDMMWETADFYCSLLEESDAVHKALEIITEVEIEYIHEMYEISENIVPLSWPFIWAPKEKGVYLADDTMGMISPDMYEEFGVTYNNKISEEFGGIMLHSCTTKEEYFDKIMKNKNIRSINFASQYSSDMNKIYEFFGGKVVIIPHYCHTDNPQVGTVTEFLEKVISCWKPEYPSIIYIMENPEQLIQQDVYEVFCKYFNLGD